MRGGGARRPAPISIGVAKAGRAFDPGTDPITTSHGLVVVLRHAPPVHEGDVIYAYGDNELNPEGVAWATVAGVWLGSFHRPVSTILTSPLVRAVQTADVVARQLQGDLRPGTDDRLIEDRYELGIAGRHGATVLDEVPEMRSFARHTGLARWDARDAALAVESPEAVGHRMRDVAESAAQAHPDGLSVLVSHGNPIEGLCLDLTNRWPDEGWRFVHRDVRVPKAGALVIGFDETGAPTSGRIVPPQEMLAYVASRPELAHVCRNAITTLQGLARQGLNELPVPAVDVGVGLG